MAQGAVGRRPLLVFESYDHPEGLGAATLASRGLVTMHSLAARCFRVLLGGEVVEGCKNAWIKGRERRQQTAWLRRVYGFSTETVAH